MRFYELNENTFDQEYKKRWPSAAENQGRTTERIGHSRVMEHPVDEEHGPRDCDWSDQELILHIHARHVQQNNGARNGEADRDRSFEQARAESQEVAEIWDDSFIQGSCKYNLKEPT